MSACPFCFSEMQEAFSQGLLHEACSGCGALWLQGDMLEKVVGNSATDTLLREAKGQPGQCKGCQESLQYVPNCPRCGLTSPTCPQCHNAPLPVAEVSGVKVDVCTKCRSIGLDARELEQIQEAVRKERFLELELRPRPARTADGAVADMACATCARKLKPQHAFTWDGKFYCGSCAPSEAAPYDVVLTKADPSSASSVGYQVGIDGGLTVAQGPISAGLAWLFSKLFG